MDCFLVCLVVKRVCLVKPLWLDLGDQLRRFVALHGSLIHGGITQKKSEKEKKKKS